MASPRVNLSNSDLLLEKALIDGTWVIGSAEPITVDDPFIQEDFATVPSLDEDDARRAIDAAHRAFPDWAAKTASERGAILRRWSELIDENTDDLARLMTLENGKTFKEAQGEVAYGNGFIQFYAEEATRMMGEIIPANQPGRRMQADRQPVGVCAAITPWNFPLAMLTRKVGPALAAGCTMIAKPASQTPLTALAFARLGEEAGLPKGVFNCITGKSSVLGDVLTSSPLVRKLTFTGSTEVGVKLYEACAKTMKKISMELGGNAPLLIFDDADLDAAIDTAMVAKFRNSGQTCVAANRIYVQDGIKDRFLSAFAEKVKDMKAGDGFDEASDVGPLIDPDGFAKVQAHRDSALKGGAQCLAGGGEPGGLLFEPTLLGDVPQDAQLASEETFGPLAGVITFSSFEEGLRLANDTPFGLAAYLCSSDPKTIERASMGLESGMVGINTGLISTPFAPFGGVKMSGLGREGSHHGLEEYLNVKYLCQAEL
ncbi:NAD-dependent succinate-semialdehyde dehydrogenase [Altericroceibacterium spongiae]|uniref:NAD-dependent succinate-semialdehyde dehydrogenase n=1 Tax=Altericroceibacterium spongiae TaxID=2320269 RepID=A0A420EJX3_9SPHN|nr:NAD-dependent succinate-semialdehyde dehydrogenase [Altericroceibacterium spongiae]RKF21022.1 NAD-dependent succinate-semialdehyde dehydrogenase [Altericroceibacterium spongiae]